MYTGTVFPAVSRAETGTAVRGPFAFVELCGAHGTDRQTDRQTHRRTLAPARMLVRLCNGVVAIVLLTFSTVEMLAPIDGAKGLYYGMPEEILQGSDAAAQFGRHCVAVIGALQFGAAASLLLSTGATTPANGIDGQHRRRSQRFTRFCQSAVCAHAEGV